jgi:hypothetical protein
MSFSVGDKVRAFGNKGKVKSLSTNGMFVVVRFDNTEHDVIFYLDGKLFKWNKLPILKKVK